MTTHAEQCPPGSTRYVATAYVTDSSHLPIGTMLRTVVRFPSTDPDMFALAAERMLRGRYGEDATVTLGPIGESWRAQHGRTA